MRHQIALNIDNFRAAPDDFVARPAQIFPELQQAVSPFLSVIIPTYNGQRYLPGVLDALAKQTFARLRDHRHRRRQHRRLGDADRTRLSARAPDRQSAQHGLRGQLQHGRRRLGRTHCRAAQQRHRAGTDLAGTSLRSASAPIPQAAAVTSKMLLFDERTRIHTTGDMLGPDGMPRNRGVWELDQGQFDAETDVFSGCGGATAYRRDVWQALGGFDEDFWMYLEDVDLSFRARLMGWQVVLAPDARVYHHLSASGGDTLSSYYVGRNTIWMLAKNMPDALLRENLWAIVSAQVGIAVDALRNFRGEAARRRLPGQLAGPAGFAGPTAQTPPDSIASACVRQLRFDNSCNSAVDIRKCVIHDRHED